MGIFSKKIEPQIEEVRNAETGTLLEYIEGMGSISVNEVNVMQIGGIKNAVELISGTVGVLPVSLYREKNGKIDKVEEDERLFLLNNEPNSFEKASNFKRDLVKDMLLYGKSYSFIDKKGLKVDSLHYIKSNQVTKTDVINKNGIIIDKRYNFTMNNISLEKNFYNIMEICFGNGVLHENNKILETLIYINDYDNYVFKNAVLPSGVLETEGRLTQEGAKNLKEQMEKLYSGARNFFRPMILEQGIKWKTIQQNPNDLMLDSAKDNAIKDIERIFNLPYGILNNSANASVNEQNLLYLQRTITPIIVALEDTFNQSLLLESEKKEGYYFRFDVSELLKMTLDKTIEYTVNGLTNGVYTINEARKIMDLDPIEGADKLILSLGGVFMDNKGKLEVPNTGEGIEEKEPIEEVSEKVVPEEPIIEEDKEEGAE